MDLFPDESGVEEAARELRTICDVDNGRTALVGAVAPAVLAVGWGVTQAMGGQYNWVLDTASIFIAIASGPYAVIMVEDSAEDGQSRQRMLMRARHNNVAADIETWGGAALRRHQVYCYGRVVTKFAAAAMLVQVAGMALERTFGAPHGPAAVHATYKAG